MFNSIAIDVTIGLVFIFLLYSLLASILQEFIAKILGLRARMLLKAISKLLDDDDDFNEARGLCRFNVVKGYYLYPFKNRPFSKIFYSHPNIKYLGKNEFSRKPAYLSDALFAETLIKILRTDKFTGTQNQMEIIRGHLESTTGIVLKKYKPTQKSNSLVIGDETKSALLELVADSGNDLEKFKARLEQWFNEMMDRTEGWYTRQTRVFLFVIGFTLAIGFNIDSIAIAKLLATNNTARSAMVQSAYAFKKTEYTDDRSDTALIRRAKNLMTTQIDSANQVLGLGYKETNPVKITCKTYGLCIVGWLITALAISLGAPFWFDLLQKIMAVRQAGSKPAESIAKSTPSKSQTLSPNDSKNRVG
jgi:hypothetical protein